ncbi:MAG: N-acetylmuramic acid 6-phosphate etherase [Erysipelotrichaceae bacterium]
MNITKLNTEKRNERSFNLDEMSSLEIVTLMNDEDKQVAYNVEKQLVNISKMVDACYQSIDNGGRIIYVGAGTSGRLAMLDACECPPTYGVEDGLVIAISADGIGYFDLETGDNEDKEELGYAVLDEYDVNSKDIVIGIAASGRTPYVIGSLKRAHDLGCVTGCVCCNENSEIGKFADIKIEVNNGNEVLTGSTRLKSGTSQKMILNMITTSTMVLLGKAYTNLMVDMKLANKKLEQRALNMIMMATEVSEEVAAKVLSEAHNEVKTAILMILLDVDYELAKNKLGIAKGHIKKAINL